MRKAMDLLISDSKYVISGLFLKACLNLEISINELYVLIFLENAPIKTFDPKKISKSLGLSEKEVLAAFNNLLTKNIITIDTNKDEDNRMIETMNLNGVYEIMGDLLESNDTEKKVTNIFTSFETEFGRTISPMEYEIINAWLENETTEELIIGALKEAVYNGAKSFRYIDKIIYDWNSKGFKNMSDVKKHLKNREAKKNQEELFDYNWLEDDENDN